MSKTNRLGFQATTIYNSTTSRMSEPVGLFVSSKGVLYWANHAFGQFMGSVVNADRLSALNSDFESVNYLTGDADFLYATTGNGSIIRFSLNGSESRTIASNFETPTGIHIIGSKLFVADMNANDIFEIDLRKSSIRKLGLQILNPIGVWVVSIPNSGKLIVLLESLLIFCIIALFII